MNWFLSWTWSVKGYSTLIIIKQFLVQKYKFLSIFKNKAIRSDTLKERRLHAADPQIYSFRLFIVYDGLFCPTVFLLWEANGGYNFIFYVVSAAVFIDSFLGLFRLIAVCVDTLFVCCSIYCRLADTGMNATLPSYDPLVLDLLFLHYRRLFNSLLQTTGWYK